MEKCEIIPLNDNIVVEEINESMKSGGIITSTGNEKNCLKAFKVVGLPKKNPFVVNIGDRVLCREDDLGLYTYSAKKLYLIKGDYLSGIIRRTVSNGKQN